MNKPAHSHDSEHDAEYCPYCKHEITHDEFLAIEARIAKDQKEKWDSEEKKLKAQFLESSSELHKQHAQALADKDKEKELSVAAAVKTAEQKIIDDNKKVSDQIAKDRIDIDTERKNFNAEQKSAELANENLKRQHAQELENKDKATKDLVANANKAALKKANTDKLASDEIHRKELEQQRKVMEEEKDKELRAKSAQGDKENERLKKRVDDLSRQLEKKSNDELGDGAEIELYDELKKAFPDDVITRVKKGVAGADITHEVHSEGRLCGVIVYDSKNRNNWKTSYSEQLRTDQLSAKADHAILATRKFPKGVKELGEQNGVLLVNPARAAVLADMIRRSIILLSTIQLSETGKKDKQTRLYEFITSSRCMNLFQRAGDQIELIRELDIKEKSAQERVRKTRAQYLGSVEKAVLGELQDELHKIIGV